MDAATDPSKPKRSLFNRPAWAQDTSYVRTESADVFSRSQNYQDVVAERELHKREKAKKKAGEAKRRSESIHETGSLSPSVKRRRVSNELDSNCVVVVDTEDNNEAEDLSVRTRPSESTVDKIARRYERITDARKTRTAPKEVIELGDSSGDERVQASAPRPSSTQSGAHILEDDDDESDPEFAALAREAREKRRLREQQQQEHQQHSKTSADSFSNSISTPFDPTVQLFITSQIPNTAPLIVSRKLSQRLQEVREAWCKKQEFPPDFSATVFFTYQLRKTYDVTTCKSLGVRVDSNGKVISEDLDPFREPGEHDTKIHIEAVTPAIWEELKAKKAASGKGRRSRSAANGEDGTPAFGGAEDNDKEEFKEETTIKLLLRAKGYKDVKIKVRPVSHVSFFLCYHLWE